MMSELNDKVKKLLTTKKQLHEIGEVLASKLATADGLHGPTIELSKDALIALVNLVSNEETKVTREARNAVKEAEDDLVRATRLLDNQDDDEYKHKIDPVELANNPISATAFCKTNGQIIHEMFPDWEIKEFKDSSPYHDEVRVRMPMYGGLTTLHSFDRSWWYAPYITLTETTVTAGDIMVEVNWANKSSSGGR